MKQSDALLSGTWICTQSLRQYRILHITLPALDDRRHGSPLYLVLGSPCTDAETLEPWHLCYNALGERYLYSRHKGGVWRTEPMVAYAPEGAETLEIWLKPYTEFFDFEKEAQPLTIPHRHTPILTRTQDNQRDYHGLS